MRALLTMPASAVHRGGSGSPLVLLHGFGSSWRAWRPVLDELASSHDVIALTLPGHRGGPKLAPRAACSVAALTAIVEQELNALGLEQAHLAGNSLGGWIAIELARRNRARSVTAFSPAGAWRNARDFTRLERLFKVSRRVARLAGPRSFAALELPSVRRHFLSAMLEHGDRMPATDAAAAVEDFAYCAIFERLAAAVRTEGAIQRHHPGSLTCPIRVAWAGSDRVIPFARYGRPMLDALPGATLATLADVGHVPMYDDPQLVTRTILQVTTRS
jgi:pimeloyl-ACP methyl ester carboxylesterase